MEKYWNQIKKYSLSVQARYASLVWKYIVAHIFEFEVFILLYLLIGLYTRIPYINLVLTPFLYHLAMVCIAIKLFSIRLSMLTNIVMFGFLISLLGTLAGYEVFVDELSNFLYLGIWYICIANIRTLRSTQ